MISIAEYIFEGETPVNWPFPKDMAIVRVLQEVLPDARPPWWRLDLRWGLKRRKWFAIECAKMGWPQWYAEAIKCGADADHLAAVSMLIYGHVPEVRKRPIPM